MNKRTKILILLLSAGMLALPGLGIVLTKKVRSLEQENRELERQADQLAGQLSDSLRDPNAPIIEIYSDEEPAAADTADNSPEAATEQATEGALIFEEPESEGAMRHTRVTDLSRRAIFVGDSRTVGLWHAIDDYGDECIYIGESGEGYDWFIETGLDRMEDAISDNPGVPVIFNLGVNDCENISNYIAVYQDLIAAQPDTHFYIMSVNPVTEDSVNVPNSDVIQFNEVMQDVFADRYIDTYRQMLEYGFVSPDGIHYSQATYRDIHNYALLQLAEYEMKASSHN